MDRVKNLERDVAQLDDGEFKRFASWFATYQQKVWDRQIARDAKAGKLDFLIQEAIAEKKSGTLRDL
ncbi:MAG TPA: hypothetical protein PLX06_13495 [Fimbriimonadaceae bacterium]|nr:hypothetical protein [Fimbriimonadaceae bacterium]